MNIVDIVGVDIRVVHCVQGILVCVCIRVDVVVVVHMGAGVDIPADVRVNVRVNVRVGVRVNVRVDVLQFWRHDLLLRGVCRVMEH